MATPLSGTLVMVGIAALISMPFGILGGGVSGGSGPETQAGQSCAHVRKVLTGFPSILAGVFAYGAVVLITGGFSAVAGGIALSILMLPTVMLTAEEAIRMVPRKCVKPPSAWGPHRPRQSGWCCCPPLFRGY